MDQYTKEVLDYFDKKAYEYDLKNSFEHTINALESQVRVLIIYGLKCMDQLISNDELDILINNIQSGKEKLRYKGHPIEIKKTIVTQKPYI